MLKINTKRKLEDLRETRDYWIMKSKGSKVLMKDYRLMLNHARMS